MTTPKYRELLNILTEGRTLPESFDSWGMKTVDGLRRTANKFHWPAPGQSIRSWNEDHSDDSERINDPCSRYPGDGLTVALTVSAMSSNRLPIHSILLVAFRSEEVVGRERSKIRTSGDVMVIDEWLINEIDLYNMNFYGVNFCGVNLFGADLRNTNLSSADMRNAHLGIADLRKANMRGAILRNANVKGADFSSADLRGTDFCKTDLRYVCLRNATYCDCTLWPEGFDVTTSGAVRI